MNLLNNTRCYLAGPVEHDDSATSWRREVAESLLELGVKPYDPLIKPPWLDKTCHVGPPAYRNALESGPIVDSGVTINEESAIEANRMMRIADLRIVHAVDWIICYLPIQFTAGTFEEVYEALRAGKPVLFCCPDGIPSTWMVAAAAKADNYKQCFFYDWGSLIEHVLKIDKGQVLLDPIKWIFLAWREEDWANPLARPDWR